MSWTKFFKNSRLAIFLGLTFLAAIPVILNLADVNFYSDDQAGVLSVLEKAVYPPEPEKVFHIEPPDNVKAIYMTSWVASLPEWRTELAEFIRDSELNSLIIDVKDYSGIVAFDTDDALIDFVGSKDVRMPDIAEFIDELHGMGIYVIARITVFQDPIYAAKFPQYAVWTKDGSVWKDYKGLSYVDPGAREFWRYIVAIGIEAEKLGFDELNFDYIRFPSDGNMKDIAYPVSGNVNKDVSYEVLLANGSSTLMTATGREHVLSGFFEYLDRELEKIGIPISADVFGMTTTNKDDLNIGQVLESIEPYFDYIAPMVYPSHYPKNFQGLANPAQNPYEVIKYSMDKAVERLTNAGSNPQKLRPWLQDFDLGAIYDEAKIRAQKQAVYDAGLTGWMIWDPSNRYTKPAYYELEFDETGVDKLE